MQQAEMITRDGVRAPAGYWRQADQSLALSRITLYTLNPLTLDRPFFDATGGPFNTVPISHWLVLHDADGVMGQGPCTATMEQVILPMVLRTGGAKTPLEWYNHLYWQLRNRGFATEALVELGRFDTVLHDIMAKRAGQPFHRFLGATRDWARVYASGFGTNLTDSEMEEEAETFLRGGYTVFKMKAATRFGTQLDRDVERVAMARKLLGDGAPLAVDVNQLWQADDALAFLRRIEPYDIAWYEEPVHSYDVRQLERLTAQCPVPVAAGESMRNRYQFYPYIKAGVKHLQPVPSNLSGVRDWLYARDEALEFGLEFSSGGFSHLTASYVATAREEDMVEYLYPIMHKMYELMDLKPQEKDGTFILPDEPGMCMRPDFALWEKLGYVAKKEMFTPGNTGG